MRPLIAVVVCLALTGAAFADSITFSAVGESPNDHLQASALFEITATQLIITLTNTSLVAVEVPSDLLSGVYFDLINENALTPVSATLLAGGSVVLSGSTVYSGPLDVGSEFAYRDDLTSGFNGAQYGISNSGMDDVFGPGDRFDTSTDLDSPASPDGSNYGMASAGGISPSANTGVTNDPVILGSVQFVFDYTGDLGVDDISNISFQYGTSQSEPNITTSVVPEPSTVSLLGIGIAGILAARRIRGKQS